VEIRFADDVDEDETVGLVLLDTEVGNLVLRQANLDGTMGDDVSIRLASLGTMIVQGSSLKLHAAARPDKPLLELSFDTAKTAARWCRALRQHSSSHATPRGQGLGSEFAEAPVPSGDSGTVPVASTASDYAPVNASGRALRALIGNMEEQVQLYQAMEQRKDEQMVDVRNKMMSIMEGINECQASYLAQREVLEKQQSQIEDLQGRLRRKQCAAAAHLVDFGPAAMARAACEANAAEASAGWQRSGSRRGPPALWGDDTHD